MMDFIRSFFQRRSVHDNEENKAPQSKYDKHGVTVEFYPESRMYLVRTAGPHRFADYSGDRCYLWVKYPTGIIEQVSMVHAAQFNDEEAAWRFADKYIEQCHKENVLVIRR